MDENLEWDLALAAAEEHDKIQTKISMQKL